MEIGGANPPRMAPKRLIFTDNPFTLATECGIIRVVLA